MSEDRGLSIFDEEQPGEEPTQVIPRVAADEQAPVAEQQVPACTSTTTATCG